MVLPLDFLLLVVITTLTVTLLLVNYVAYLSRGQKHRVFFETGALIIAGVAVSSLLGPVMFSLGQQYGTSTILSRWGLTFSWAFLLTLGSACTSFYERHSEGRISLTLNVVATLLIGFALVAGLISGGSLPALPASILSLGLAALFTSLLRLAFEKRKDKIKKGLFERLRKFFKH
jgi:hypothetical protein